MGKKADQTIREGGHQTLPKRWAPWKNRWEEAGRNGSALTAADLLESLENSYLRTGTRPKLQFLYAFATTCLPIPSTFFSDLDDSSRFPVEVAGIRHRIAQNSTRRRPYNWAYPGGRVPLK